MYYVTGWLAHVYLHTLHVELPLVVKVFIFYAYACFLQTEFETRGKQEIYFIILIKFHKEM